METKNTLKKAVTHAFGKDVYLLGKDKEGVKYWLESSKWDCGWYWGFGYVETYTNNNDPAASQDINSHQHINSSFMGQMYGYDSEKKGFVKGEYINNIYNSPVLNSTTFDESEGWQLSELFKQFYLLREMADFCHKDLPGCHVTTSPVNHGDLKTWNKQINEIMIPAIITKIIQILSA